ncbi:hypothetical protein [Paraburkholderia aromaticivorans]|uniref:hypothetical protein n=1 Tax=Paraburkholderia aromaticivorans TaxID=2026199 RepID=UPI001455E526|nr:hypothetical protein [Paraburkholderia aromaticivorans]
MTTALAKSIAVVLAFGGLTSGLLAAWLWEKSTRVPVDPLDGDPTAVVPELEQQAWWAAQFRANQQIGRLNVLAARWTAAAVVLGTLSSIVGVL